MTEAPKPGWWARNWKWFVPTGCLAMFLALAGFVALLVWSVGSMMKSSDAYRMAIARAKANPKVVQALGEPIEEGLFVSGSIHTAGSSGSASLTCPIHGPKGKGTVYVEAVRFAGEWRFNELKVGLPGRGELVDLMEGSAEPR
ncbi:MAG: cytochrome c oxidase assembly factor Coa1 family protein [Holophagaceae bacterium]